MKSMKIWAVFYSGVAQYPQSGVLSPILYNVDYGPFELPYNLQATEKTDYAYQSYGDLNSRSYGNSLL